MDYRLWGFGVGKPVVYVVRNGKSCMHQYYQMEVNILNNNQLFGLVIVKRPVTYPTDQPRATEVGKEIRNS